MRAVILAAGRGSRINGDTRATSKALLRIGGESLIERQIRCLRDAGVDEIAVVVGCDASQVRQHCGSDVTYVENLRFAETNSLYSLWLAKPLLTDGCLVLNCDVLFHPQLLDDLLTARHGCALMLEYQDPAKPALGEEEMKVRVRSGRVVELAKTMDPSVADGENVGMVRFEASAVPLLTEILDSIVARGDMREWAPRAFSAFACQRPLWAIGTRGFPWIEVDFAEDYKRAVSEVLPQIEGPAQRMAMRRSAPQRAIAAAAGR